jgi:hypothetical protein
MGARLMISEKTLKVSKRGIYKQGKDVCGEAKILHGGKHAPPHAPTPEACFGVEHAFGTILVATRPCENKLEITCERGLKKLSRKYNFVSFSI